MLIKQKLNMSQTKQDHNASGKEEEQKHLSKDISEGSTNARDLTSSELYLRNVSHNGSSGYQSAIDSDDTSGTRNSRSSSEDHNGYIHSLDNVDTSLRTTDTLDKVSISVDVEDSEKVTNSISNFQPLRISSSLDRRSEPSIQGLKVCAPGKKRNASNVSLENRPLPQPSYQPPHPPDGGWGWVVVFGSFIVQMLADGCAFSFGVLFVELLDYFGESKAKTAWVGSLFVAVPLLMGPVASILTNKFGCRLMTVIGGIVTMVGFVASSRANSIGELCFSFGLIAGTGLGLVYVPAIVIVTVYFEEKRAFATGIAVAGSGIGTFIFAPLIELLIDLYGWRGAMLVLGAIMLNITVCGMLFRPLQSTSKSLVASSVIVQDEQEEEHLLPNAAPCTTNKQLIPRQNEVHLSTNMNVTESLSRLDLFKAKYHVPNIITPTASQMSIYKNCKVLDLHSHSCPDVNALTAKESLIDSSSSNSTTSEPPCPCSTPSGRSSTIMSQLVDPTVLQSPSFMFLCLSILLLYLSYDVPYIFTPHMAVDMGISEENASFLVSIIGITSTFGQVFIGYIGDLQRVNTLLLYIVLTAVAGVFTLLVPWFNTYVWLCIFAVAYGFFISANYTLVSVLIVEMLGIEKFTYAYGIEALSEGLANIIGPPFAGWLTDITGSYNAAFIVNGCIMIGSGLMLLAMPCLYRCDKYVINEAPLAITWNKKKDMDVNENV